MMCILKKPLLHVGFWPYLSTLDEFGMFCYKNPPKLRISPQWLAPQLRKSLTFGHFSRFL